METAKPASPDKSWTVCEQESEPTKVKKPVDKSEKEPRFLNNDDIIAQVAQINAEMKFSCGNTTDDTTMHTIKKADDKAAKVRPNTTSKFRVVTNRSPPSRSKVLQTDYILNVNEAPFL